jgi:hypothetical protein
MSRPAWRQLDQENVLRYSLATASAHARAASQDVALSASKAAQQCGPTHRSSE